MHCYGFAVPALKSGGQGRVASLLCQLLAITYLV